MKALREPPVEAEPKSCASVESRADKRLSFRSNFVWVSAGAAVFSACNWIMLGTITKTGTTVEVGQYSFGLAVTQPIIYLSQLNLASVQASDVSGRSKPTSYFALRFWTTVLAMLLILVYASLARTDVTTKVVVVWTGIGACFDSLADVIYGLLRLNERMERSAISMIARGVLSVAGVVLGMKLFHSVIAAAAGSALASALTTLTLDRYLLVRTARGSVPGNLLRWPKDVCLRDLADLGWIALPMGIVLMLGSLTLNIPRFFVDSDLGHSQLGIFAALAQFISLGRIAVISLGTAGMTRLAIHLASGRRDLFVRLTFKLSMLALGIAVLSVVMGAAFGPQMLRLLYSDRYAHETGLFVIILAAGGATYLASILGSVLTAAQVFRAQVPQLLSAAGVSLIASWLLIPRFGLTGAAISLAVGSGWMVVTGIWMLARLLRIGARSRCSDLGSGSENTAL